MFVLWLVGVVCLGRCCVSGSVSILSLLPLFFMSLSLSMLFWRVLNSTKSILLFFVACVRKILDCYIVYCVGCVSSVNITLLFFLLFVSCDADVYFRSSVPVLQRAGDRARLRPPGGYGPRPDLTQWGVRKQERRSLFAHGMA